MAYSGTSVLAIFITNLCLVLIFASLRCFTRIVMVRKFLLDDWLATATVPLYIVYSVFFILMIRIPDFNTETNNLPAYLPEYQNKILYLTIASLVSIFAIGLIKISFGFTLLRFMVEPVHILIVKATAIVTIVMFFLTLCICTPIDYLWKEVTDPYQLVWALYGQAAASNLTPLGYCKPTFTYVLHVSYAQAALFIAIDVLLGLVMPFLMLRKVNMMANMKTAVLLLLALGSIPAVAAIVKIFYVYTIGTDDSVDSGKPMYIWSSIEFTWCIVGTALTTFKPLAVRLGIFKDSLVQLSPVHGESIGQRRLGQGRDDLDSAEQGTPVVVVHSKDDKEGSFGPHVDSESA